MSNADDYYLLRDKQTRDNAISAQVQFPETHPLYRGHFPERAVVPGVAMLEIAKALVADMHSGTVQIRGISGVKYLQPLLPERGRWYHVALEYAWSGTESVVADLKLWDEEKVYVKMKGVDCNWTKK